MSDDHGTNDTRTLQERMAEIGRSARAESPLEAARQHLGTVETPLPESDAPDLPPHDLETGEIFADPTGIAITTNDAEIAELAADAGFEVKLDENLTIDSAPAPVTPIVAEAPATPPPPPVVEAAQTQQPPSPAPQAEVIVPERAADGLPAPFAARDTGSLINLLEGGQFSADVIAALTALATGMTEIAQATGKRQKGVLTIKVNLQTDDTGEAFFVQGDFAVRAPRVERRKTLLWPDEKGHMSPSQPRQKVFFGVKGVGDDTGSIRQIGDSREVRTVS